MHSDPSATFLGKEMGTGVVRSAPAELSSLVAPQRPVSQNIHADRLDRSTPFGLTVIVGGTNVRFCLSTAADPEPIKDGIKWQKMKEVLSLDVEPFKQSHDISYPYLAKMCLDFIAKQFSPADVPPPLHNLCAITFSVAGQVTDQGRGALITTTNTGLTFINQPLADDFLVAIEREIAARTQLALKQGKPELVWPTLPSLEVDVMNDAEAALFGEVYYGNLQGKNVGVIILGTGCGGKAQLVKYKKSTDTHLKSGQTSKDSHIDPHGPPNMDECGHRNILDTVQDIVTCYPNGDLAQYINPDGSFKKLDGHLVYAEHLIAGPWNAIRFVRSILENDKAKIALARRIAEDPRDPEKLAKAIQALNNLGALKVEHRTEWAVDSDADLVRAVNNVVLSANLIVEKLELDARKSSEHFTADDALIEKAYRHFWDYFTYVGRVLGSKYATARDYGYTFDRLILCGGIGESCNLFPQYLRKAVLKHLRRVGNIPEGVINFSTITPECREDAANRAKVIAKHEALTANVH
jgi:hypothetical protein